MASIANTAKLTGHDKDFQFLVERLGLGPDACHARNPSLVYGRVTGWGQEGPMAFVDYLYVIEQEAAKGSD